MPDERIADPVISRLSWIVQGIFQRLREIGITVDEAEVKDNRLLVLTADAMDKIKRRLIQEGKSPAWVEAMADFVNVSASGTMH